MNDMLVSVRIQRVNISSFAARHDDIAGERDGSTMRYQLRGAAATTLMRAAHCLQNGIIDLPLASNALYAHGCLILNW